MKEHAQREQGQKGAHNFYAGNRFLRVAYKGEATEWATNNITL